MRKTTISIILILLLILIASFAFAQIPENLGKNNYRRSNKNFGIKGGINFSNIHGDHFGNTKSRIGFIIGLFNEIPRTKQFSIQPEILFSMKGWKVEYSDYNEWDSDGYKEKFWARLNYIELPVLGKFKLDNINNLKPIFYFGPCFGINVSSTYRDEYEDDYDSGTYTRSMKGVSVFDFSFTPGIMLEVNNTFVFDFRYSLGLTNIVSNNEDGISMTNSVISLMLGSKL